MVYASVARLSRMAMPTAYPTDYYIGELQHKTLSRPTKTLVRCCKNIRPLKANCLPFNSLSGCIPGDFSGKIHL